MNRRNERVSSLIQEQISKIIYKETSFKDILLTVINVKTTKDLGYADILISVYPYAKTKLVEEILNKRKFIIQGLLNRILKMRVLPKIRFKFSESGKRLDKLSEIFKKIKEEKN